MKKSDEFARIQELLSLNILDTPREERFDRVTSLVARIFNIPSVAISLITEDRQWFKSTVGLKKTETTRDESICTNTIKEGYLEVMDTLEDERFQNLTAVTGEGQLFSSREGRLRFYAGAVIKGPTGQPVGTLCLLDVTPRRLSAAERSWLISFAELVEYEINRDADLEQQQRKLLETTLRDSTTGLPGEILLTDMLDRLIKGANGEGPRLAILHLKVDNLDILGRLHGSSMLDSILRNLAARLTATDQRLHIAGRTAAKRFVLVVPLETLQSPQEVASRIVKNLSAPMIINETTIRTEIAAGVAIYPLNGAEANHLLDRARMALTDGQAWRDVNVFSRIDDASALRNHEIADRLESALLGNKLTLDYQPIFSADGSQILKFEAFARWQDTKFGNVSPGEFVPIAERSSRLSHLLTLWALRTACMQARQWEGMHDGAPPRVAVNVPARQFYDPNFVEMVTEILEEAGLSPERLTLELTEESLIQDIGQAIDTMKKLSASGIKIALDDFGTGYSSLSHLRRLPINTLKIDKSFIDGLPHEPEAVKLASRIIQIAQDMGLDVVAEGVEYEEQRALLDSFSCDMIQGYLLGRPAHADDVHKLTGSAEVAASQHTRFGFLESTSSGFLAMAVKKQTKKKNFISNHFHKDF